VFNTELGQIKRKNFKLQEDAVSVTLRLSAAASRAGFTVVLVTRPAEYVQFKEGLSRRAWTHQGNGAVE
jgi:hypothetical protein